MGVTVAGNVVLGSVAGYTGSGTSAGTGLSDFVDVAYDGSKRDAHPSAASPLVGAGDATHAVTDDLSGAARSSGLDTGCYDAP